MTLRLACVALVLSACGTDLVDDARWPSVELRSGALMLHARAGHTATALADGRVLVTGGAGDDAAGTELYDRAADRWTAGAPLSIARNLHTATRLKDGRVLVAGGRVGSTFPSSAAPQSDWQATASAELLDPATGHWTPTLPMRAARSGHTATLLPDGRVLVAGGSDDEHVHRSLEVYDPRTNAWDVAGDMLVQRRRHTATLMPDGRILFVDGCLQTRDDVCAYAASSSGAELFDPVSQTARDAGAPGTWRWGHATSLLPDGSVVVSGGYAWGSAAWNPKTGLWRNAGKMMGEHHFGPAFTLSSGQVLVVGGAFEWDDHASVDLRQPDGTWAHLAASKTAFPGNSAGAQVGDDVLVSGGLLQGAPVRDTVRAQLR